MQVDFFVWGMYYYVDIVVKVVMIGLILVLVVIWVIFFCKGVEIFVSKCCFKCEQQQLVEVCFFDQVSDIVSVFEVKSFIIQFINEVQNEFEFFVGVEDNEGIKE